MRFTIYDASIPPMIRGLENLARILDKAAAQAKSEDHDLNSLLEARLDAVEARAPERGEEGEQGQSGEPGPLSTSIGCLSAPFTSRRQTVAKRRGLKSCGTRSM